MRINHILFFLGTIFFAACSGNPASKDILPRDRMVSLLTQVHIADGRLVSYSQSPDTLYKYGMANYLYLFKSYHTDSVQFRRSILFYAEQPELFDKMYEDVMKILTAKTDSLNKVRVAIAKADSIKNAHVTKHLQDSVKKAQQIRDKVLKKGEAKN